MGLWRRARCSSREVRLSSTSETSGRISALDSEHLGRHRAKWNAICGCDFSIFRGGHRLRTGVYIIEQRTLKLVKFVFLSSTDKDHPLGKRPLCDLAVDLHGNLLVLCKNGGVRVHSSDTGEQLAFIAISTLCGAIRMVMSHDYQHAHIMDLHRYKWLKLRMSTVLDAINSQRKST